MILPSKHLPQSRALIRVGGEILRQLDEPRAVSELWERVRSAHDANSGQPPISFDWFVLALSFLHAIFSIEMNRGVIAATRRPN
jgi:ABC-3C biological conflict system middle component